MADSISLDRSSQSTLTKAVKNIKTLIKKNELKIRDECDSDATTAAGKKAVLGKKKSADQKDSKSTWQNNGKGVVYLGHIPKGFYEEEMHSYFSQFGRVTRLNLVRSKKNGKPKGYAFIEFLYSEVAQVVAETMNNYLMCGRLLKAEYVSGERTYRGMFRCSKIRPENCPGRNTQKRWIQKTNKKLTPEEEAASVVHEIKRFTKLKKKLEKSGIQLDCQIESSSLTPLNNKISKTGRHPILLIDESDAEIDFKPQPNVIRVLKRESAASVPSPGAKKVKVESEKGVSEAKPRRKRGGTSAVKSRSSLKSLLSPNGKVKAETERNVSKNNLQPNVTSVKKEKAGRRPDVSDTKSQFSGSEGVESRSFSTSTPSSSGKKVKAEKDAFKTRLQPNFTSLKKRRSFSMSPLSRNMKKAKVEKERGVSNTESEFTVTEIAEHRPLSTSALCRGVEKVKAEADSKSEPSVTGVVKRKVLPTFTVSCSAKKVKAKGGRLRRTRP